MSGRKRKTTPVDVETRAYWEYARRELAAMIARTESRIARRKAADAKRRDRLRRWSFGLLGR